MVVVSKGFFFLITSIHDVKEAPWTPTFSLGVVALGGISVGELESVRFIATCGKTIGVATLVAWSLTFFADLALALRSWLVRRVSRRHVVRAR
ncbi:MAG: hypothetical protein ACYCPT_07705 [Acidimicrobiales bacterium]